MAWDVTAKAQNAVQKQHGKHIGCQQNEKIRMQGQYLVKKSPSQIAEKENPQG